LVNRCPTCPIPDKFICKIRSRLCDGVPSVGNVGIFTQYYIDNGLFALGEVLTVGGAQQPLTPSAGAFSQSGLAIMKQAYNNWITHGISVEITIINPNIVGMQVYILPAPLQVNFNTNQATTILTMPTSDEVYIPDTPGVKKYYIHAVGGGVNNKLKIKSPYINSKVSLINGMFNQYYCGSLNNAAGSNITDPASQFGLFIHVESEDRASFISTPLIFNTVVTSYCTFFNRVKE